MSTEDVKETDALPEGSKIILAQPKVKKERTQAQKAAFEKMRAKRLENDDKRRLSKDDRVKLEEEAKLQQEKEEEEERLRLAKELVAKYGVDVKVDKKRGRKVGQRIPYSKKVEDQAPQPVAPPVAAPQYTNPYMSMLLSKMKR